MTGAKKAGMLTQRLHVHVVFLKWIKSLQWAFSRRTFLRCASPLGFFKSPDKEFLSGPRLSHAEEAPPADIYLWIFIYFSDHRPALIVLRRSGCLNSWEEFHSHPPSLLLSSASVHPGFSLIWVGADSDSTNN